MFAVILTIFIFAAKENLLAQFPSFELYEIGGTIYPSVSGAEATPTPSEAYVILTATITDASGVSSAVATIEGVDDSEQEMVDDGEHEDGESGDNVFGTIFDVESLSLNKGQNYQIDILATDNLLNASLDSETDETVYKQVASFMLEPDVPWISGWSYRKQIAISNTNVESDLTDFPLYVKISDDPDMSSAKDNGYDIRFTDSDGAFLPYERESWSGGNGTAVTADFWVKVPNIYALPSSSQNKIYMYYGNFSATDGQDATNVWGDGFGMVYHFNEPEGTTGSGSVVDSTSNTIGTPSSGILFGQSGKIANSADFSSGTGIGCGNLGSPLLTADTTISFWIYSNNYSSTRQNPFNQAYGGWGTMTVETTGKISWFFGSNGGNSSPYGSHQSNSLMSTGQWIYVVSTRDSNGYLYKWYKNGSYLNGSIYSSSYPVITTRSFTIGDGYVYPLNGKLDEFRVSNIVRSADWIKFEYCNMMSEINGTCSGDNELIFADGEHIISSEAQIISFDFTTPAVTGTINQTDHTIDLSMPYGTDITNLIPTFVASSGAIVKVGTAVQTSGVTAQDFTNPVVYTVTAEDGTTVQDYTVTVMVPTVSVVELWENDVLYPQSIWGNGNSNPNDPYNVYYHDSRAQFIILASDLIASGSGAGNIDAIYLKTYQQPGQNLSNFRIKAKLTTSTITTSWEGGWITLFGPTAIDRTDPDLATQGNWKEYVFTSNFLWDGTSNIMFDISRDDNFYTSGGGMYIRTNIGSNRMFAGYCDSCTDGVEGLQIPYRTQGGNNGDFFSSCPALKISFVN